MKTRIALVVAVMVALAGALPVLAFVALFIMQLAASIEVRSWIGLPMSLLFADHSTLQNAKVAPLLSLIPELRPPSWAAHPVAAWVLSRVHVGLPLPLVGLPVIAWGLQHAGLQLAVMRARAQQREDRTRRIQDYVRDGDAGDPQGWRREPFIGSGSGKVDRRVA